MRVATVLTLTATLFYLWLSALRVYTAEIRVEAADNLIESGRYVEGQAMALQAIEENPRNGYAWFHYGTAKYLQRQFPSAIEAYQQALPVLPHSYNAIRLLAIAQYKSQDYENAAKNLAAYLKMNPWPAVTPEEIYTMAGLSWLRVGDLSASSENLTWASHYAKEQGDLLKVLAMVTILMNQPETADYYFRSFRHYEPEKELNPYELVKNAIAASKVNGAVRFMESIHERNPADLSVVKALAIGYSHLREFDKAEALLKAAVESAPENAELRLIYGDVLYAQREFKNAFEQYDRHLQLAPESQFRQDILRKKATSRF